MRVRYLVSYHECNVSAPVLGDGNRHIAFTKHFPDRGGQYCAELTRAEWDELRRVRWSSPIMESPGCLVPDIDFVAEDGKAFTDFEECRKHEVSIAAPKFVAVPMRDLAKRSEFIATGICSDVAQYNDGEFCNAATEHRFQEWLEVKSQVGLAVKTSASYAENEGANPSPATMSDTSPFKEAVAGYKTLKEMGQCEIFAGQTPDLPQTLESGMVPATDAQGNVVGAVGILAASKGYGVMSKAAPDAPVSIESKVINTVSTSGPLMLKALAAKIGSDPDAIKAAVKASELLEWRGLRVALKPLKVAA